MLRAVVVLCCGLVLVPASMRAAGTMQICEVSQYSVWYPKTATLKTFDAADNPTPFWTFTDGGTFGLTFDPEGC